MHQHSTPSLKDTERKTPKVILVGNPNVGKSAIFGLITGKYVTVSNYPGTTVEVTYGNTTIGKRRMLFIDTPGVNTLTPLSEDEKVTRDIFLKEKPYAVVQVADAKNLRRTLLLTVQISEMGLPLILDLNMGDEAESSGILINESLLSEILGISVISTIAVQKKGIEKLRDSLLQPQKSKISIRYDDLIEKAIEEIIHLLPESNISRRSLALMILAGDESLKWWLHSELDDRIINQIELIRQQLQSRYNQPLSLVINQMRLKKAEIIINSVSKKLGSQGSLLSIKLGTWSMHPVVGFPILLIVLYGIYQFVGKFGAGTLVDLLEDTIFGKYINPWATEIVTLLLPVKFFQEILIGEYGIITMAITYAIAIVLPITGTFFIAFGILEDSGYLPRLAMMLNRLFKLMGLNGKAVLPMVLGLGCDTMATMTTRILETKKERIIVTLLLALGVPCSAQIGVILGMLGKQPPIATYIWGGIVAGVMILVGLLSSRILKGKESDFLLELPPIRQPHLSNLFVKTIGRVEWYLREAVPLFVLGTVVLFILDKIKVLGWLKDTASPLVVGFLGLPAKATEAFIVGFLRRDYGAAGLFALSEQGLLDTTQVIVSLVTITLFIPCLANFFMIVKERGIKIALWMVGFIFPFAFLVGGILNWILRTVNIVF
ncbi:MAG: ferrous iron transport protein B [Nitrospirota bacterium]